MTAEPASQLAKCPHDRDCQTCGSYWQDLDNHKKNHLLRATTEYDEAKARVSAADWAAATCHENQLRQLHLERFEIDQKIKNLAAATIRSNGLTVLCLVEAETDYREYLNWPSTQDRRLAGKG